MHIGSALPESRNGRIEVFVVALFVVMVGMTGAFFPSVDPQLPIATACVGAIAMGMFSGWNWRSLGVSGSPVGGWSRWLRIAAIAGAGMLGLVLLTIFAVKSGVDPFSLCGRAFAPVSIQHFLALVVRAPLVEETIHRLILVTAAAALFGETGAIVIGGSVFAAAHWIYGAQGPDNFVAGFLLSGAFLRSRTILVPLALHAGGNAIALIFQHYAASFTCR